MKEQRISFNILMYAVSYARSNRDSNDFISRMAKEEFEKCLKQIFKDIQEIVIIENEYKLFENLADY